MHMLVAQILCGGQAFGAWLSLTWWKKTCHRFHKETISLAIFHVPLTDDIYTLLTSPIGLDNHGKN